MGSFTEERCAGFMIRGLRLAIPKYPQYLKYKISKSFVYSAIIYLKMASHIHQYGSCFSFRFDVLGLVPLRGVQ
jgi:hypothetical protein